jgi:DNA helicase II / ATP-dependent DNA helicase PcrA
MAGTIVLAVAGAGKTYYICKELDINKRNLILAFTHENIHNINENLNKIYKCIPPNTVVTTFDSFVYNQIILPFEQRITREFGIGNFHNRGITTIQPPKKIISKNKEKFLNPQYRKKSEFEHYNLRGAYYCSNLSELAMFIDPRVHLVDEASKRISLFFDHIYIDEFQDFRLFDYDLLIALSKNVRYDCCR